MDLGTVNPKQPERTKSAPSDNRRNASSLLTTQASGDFSSPHPTAAVAQDGFADLTSQPGPPTAFNKTPRTIPDAATGAEAPASHPTFSDPNAARLHPTNGSPVNASNERENEDEEEFVFRPAYFFLYGSLMDPDVLARVVKLPQSEYPPVFRKASVSGYKMKIWAREYPVLVPRSAIIRSGDGEHLCQVTSLTNSVSNAARPRAESHGAESGDDAPEEKVHGSIWLATDMDQALRLQQYETAAYIACDIRVKLEDGSGEKTRAVTFCWAGDPNDRDLYEGKFDLAQWQRDIKPQLLGVGSYEQR
ncbi:AIG2-like protein C [Zalerion maritima]|uniref:AIG2-like protein C n=1 Tax=Zalerion maritima TaxID=339359 RepID=A0AAD5RLX5_9PEZI|nr:AIG2-like protein C [Zalerion maritima]